MPTLLHDTHPIVSAVREFVDKEVVPAAPALEHADAYPHELVARMGELGLFGALVPEEFGGLGLDVLTYARVIEEICRGFMSLAGVINSHTMAALIVLNHGTDEQKRRLLPRFAGGLARGGLCLTEPHAGSDVQAIRTVARRHGDSYLISGSKMFVTNGREGNTFALLALSDPSARPPYRGMSCFIVEKGEPGLQVVKSIAKLGYKSVDTAELLFDSFPCPVANLVGGIEGRGFKQVMSGLEAGRINIAARAVGVAQAALEETARALGSAEPPAALASIAIRVDGARLLTYWAAGMKDRGERCDLEAGMAKLYASESAQEAAADAIRILGGPGQATTGVAERLYRDTPLMMIGEGTNEIQRTIIAKNLLQRHGERQGALTSLEAQPEERRQMALAVRQLVEREIAPAAVEDDRAGRFPSTSLNRLVDLGLFGATIPQESGGLALDGAAYALIAEEIGRGSATVAAVLGDHLDATDLILRLGSAEQRERLLPGLASGTRRGGMLRRLREPAVRELNALRHSDGFILSGDGLIAGPGRHAGLFVILAPVDERMRAFVLEAGQPGFVLTEPFETPGRRGADLWHVELAGCVVPERQALGGTAAPDAAAVAAAQAAARVREAAAAVGLAQAAFETALRYSQQRSAFGVPICQHQAIQLKLADMATAIAVSRLLTHRAAAEDGAGEGAPAHAAMAHLQAAETAYMVTLEAMRIHGGYGYSAEFPVERYYRDAAALLAGEAGDEVRRRAIARHAVAGNYPGGGPA